MFVKLVKGPRIEPCPFCGKMSITKNSQGVPVCTTHKLSTIDNVKCVCGKTLDIHEGKWGPYFRCSNCGNINFKKIIGLNPQAVRIEGTLESKSPLNNFDSNTSNTSNTSSASANFSSNSGSRFSGDSSYAKSKYNSYSNNKDNSSNNNSNNNSNYSNNNNFSNKPKQPEKKKAPKEIFVTSDELDYMY